MELDVITDLIDYEAIASATTDYDAACNLKALREWITEREHTLRCRHYAQELNLFLGLVE